MNKVIEIIYKEDNIVGLTMLDLTPVKYATVITMSKPEVYILELENKSIKAILCSWLSFLFALSLIILDRKVEQSNIIKEIMKLSMRN